MNDNKSAAELIKGVIYSGQAGLTLRDIITAFTAIHSWNELVDVCWFRHNPHFSCISQQVVFFIGRGGDQFGQHLDLRWLEEEGVGVMKPSTTDKGKSLKY